jgi:tRNA A-37 threonylcarbamoyl transferase component Bud32
MNSDDWRRIEVVYYAALRLPAGERAGYLASACGADAELRRTIEKLLAEGPPSEATTVLSGSAEVSSFRPGARVGPYQIEAQLGQGGMGRVFRARDTRLGRVVAMKVIRPERAGDGEHRTRFQREARATAALNHPHICTLFDIGEHDGSLYLVMELVEGETLASRLREGPLPLDKLAQYGSQIAQALAAAHERGIIHRDLKPGNVMVTPAGIKVLDFGLAKLPGTDAGASAATALDMLVGTPAYMSPEQARGEELDARSDIFALGALLYEAATGVRAFRGSSVPDILRQVASAHPPPPSSLRPGLPAGWDSLLTRALAKDRARRFRSVADLLEAIETLRAAPAAPPPRTDERRPDPVFGRERELQVLERLLESALAGAGKVVVVTGEPGIGKTALTGNFVYAARQRHPDLLLARGACVEQYGSGEAYLLFLDALGSLLNGPGRERATALLRRYAPTWCLQFPAVFSSDAIEQLQREATGANKDRMLRELGEALAALTAETPLLLVLEDVHWADAASVDMMRHLAERARHQRLMMVGTARPEDIERGNPALKHCYAEMRARGVCEEIPLALLSAGDIAAYLNAHYSPHEFPAELAAVIHRKSEGHPLFATGAIQLLAERGDIARASGPWKLAHPLSDIELGVPGSVRSMIEKKIALLSEPQRQTLLYASVEGEEFSSTVLAALLEADELELEERLSTLEKVHRLVYRKAEEDLPDGSLATRYRFMHALYQYYLYDQLLSRRRTLLHLQAGEALERVYGNQRARVAGALALHFERGRDFSRAVTYCLETGAAALSRYANAEAVGHFSHGLELVEKLPETEQPGRRAALLFKRAQAHLALGRLKEAAEDYAAMREVCRAAADLEGECRAAIGQTVVAHNLREVDDIERYGREAMALADQTGNTALVSDAGLQWAIFLAVNGRLVEAQSQWDRCIPLARRSGNRTALVSGLTYQGVKHFWKTDYAAAEAAQSEASQLAAEIRDGFFLPLALYYLGLTRASRGRVSDGLRNMEQAFDLAQRNSNAVALSRVPNGIAWLWRETGDLGKSIEFNRHSIEFAKKYRAAEAEANALINLVYDYVLGGELGQASQALEDVRPLYEREKWNRWRFYGVRHQAAEAEFLLARRQLDRAAERAHALLEKTHEHVPKYTAIAHRLLGEIAAAAGDHHTAEEALYRSLEPFAQNPAPLVEWRHHLALGRFLADRRRPAAAREAFQKAVSIVDRIAATILDPASRDNFLKMAPAMEARARAAGG